MPEHREQLDRIEAAVGKLDGKFDRLDEKFDTHRLDTEHRVTKLETKATIYAAIAGAITGFFSTLLHRPNT